MKKLINADRAKEEKGYDIPVIVGIDINSIIIPEHHPRKYLGELESLGTSIRRDGLQEPLMVYRISQDSFGIIDGARRFMVAKELGVKTIACIIKEGVEAPEAAHLSYVKNTERNGFNPIEIALHIKRMRDDFGYSLRELEIKGYGSSAHVSNYLKLLDLPESVHKKLQAGKLLFTHGLQLTRLATAKEQERMAKHCEDFDLTTKRLGIRIDRYLSKGKKIKKPLKPHEALTDVPGVYFKDSRNMSELPDKSVHLTLSSPPYGIGMEFEKDIPHKVLMQEIREVLDEAARVTVPGGIIALNVDDITNFKGETGKNKQLYLKLMGHFYQGHLSKHQIFLTDVIIWSKPVAWRNKLQYSYKENTTHTSYRIIDNFEPVYIFRKAGKREHPPEDVSLNSKLTKEQWISWAPGVWEIAPVQNQEKSGHPAQYPDELCNRLIRMFSYEGDIVLDPWLGSGTTVKVARELGRNGFGYERDIRYKDIIMKKLGVAVVEAERKPGRMVEFHNKVMSESTELSEVVASKVNRDRAVEIVELAITDEEKELETV